MLLYNILKNILNPTKRHDTENNIQNRNLWIFAENIYINLKKKKKPGNELLTIIIIL